MERNEDEMKRNEYEMKRNEDKMKRNEAEWNKMNQIIVKWKWIKRNKSKIKLTKKFLGFCLCNGTPLSSRGAFDFSLFLAFYHLYFSLSLFSLIFSFFLITVSLIFFFSLSCMSWFFFHVSAFSWLFLISLCRS